MILTNSSVTIFCSTQSFLFVVASPGLWHYSRQRRDRNDRRGTNTALALVKGFLISKILSTNNLSGNFAPCNLSFCCWRKFRIRKFSAERRSGSFSRIVMTKDLATSSNCPVMNNICQLKIKHSALSCSLNICLAPLAPYLSAIFKTVVGGS